MIDCGAHVIASLFRFLSWTEFPPKLSECIGNFRKSFALYLASVYRPLSRASRALISIEGLIDDDESDSIGKEGGLFMNVIGVPNVDCDLESGCANMAVDGHALSVEDDNGILGAFSPEVGSRVEETADMDPPGTNHINNFPDLSLHPVNIWPSCSPSPDHSPDGTEGIEPDRDVLVVDGRKELGSPRALSVPSQEATARLHIEDGEVAPLLPLPHAQPVVRLARCVCDYLSSV